jgi:hypothetical protein
MVTQATYRQHSTSQRIASMRSNLQSSSILSSIAVDMPVDPHPIVADTSIGPPPIATPIATDMPVDRHPDIIPEPENMHQPHHPQIGIVDHIYHLLTRKRADFSFPPSLVFSVPPTKDSAQYSHRTNAQLLRPNSYCGLSLKDDDSAEVVGYECLLAEYWDVLQPYLSGVGNELAIATKDLIIEALHHLDRSKGAEWDKQLHAKQNPDSFIISGEYPFIPPSFLFAHEVVDEYYMRHHYQMLPIIYASLVLVLVSRFLFNLSRRRTDVILAGIRDILYLADVPPEQLDRIPQDSRSVLGRFRLDPVTRTYTMCPRCYALYPLSTTEKTCSHKATEQSEACGAPILQLSGKGADVDDPLTPEDERGGEGEGGDGEGGDGEGQYMPIKTYTHQSFKHWLASVLCRPGVEDIIDDYPRIFAQKDNIEDIWDTPFMREFPNAHQTPQEAGTFFSPAMEKDGRYAFSLSMDSFNPHGNVTAKHSVSATGINMVLLNFPPHLRHKVENFYYAGVIPGPGKPSNEQINHFVQLIVDEFGPFYEQGVTYSKTAKYPHGRSLSGPTV